MIKQFEGFRTQIYQDAAGLPTIGYGHRLLNPGSFPNGVTEDAAASILRADLCAAITVVELLVKVPLTQGQFDALVDFVFNLGQERFARSTLPRALNGGRYQAAGEQLLRWDLINGEENQGLRQRRLAELTLWNASTPQPMAQPKAALCKPVSSVRPENSSERAA
jgi:lysozyme